MIRIACLILTLAIPALSQARPNPDEVGICYLFKEDDLQDKGVCIISTGYGAGGTYTNLFFDKKDHLFEFAEDEEDEHIYLRDGGFYHKISSQLAKEYEHEDVLMCYKDKPFDICYREIH